MLEPDESSFQVKVLSGQISLLNLHHLDVSKPLISSFLVLVILFHVWILASGDDMRVNQGWHVVHWIDHVVVLPQTVLLVSLENVLDSLVEVA